MQESPVLASTCIVFPKKLGKLDGMIPSLIEKYHNSAAPTLIT